jgi:outer membrane immunogenic protein
MTATGLLQAATLTTKDRAVSSCRFPRLRSPSVSASNKGGAAVTDNRFSILSTLTGAELAAASATRWGGTVGVGWEYGFAPNWSAGIEYDHLFMGNSNNSFSVVSPIAAAFLNNRISQDVDMVTVRFNYRFGGWGAPVAARY